MAGKPRDREGWPRRAAKPVSGTLMALTRRAFVHSMAALTAAAGLRAAPRRRPNVLFILLDDVGWMDTSLYGGRFYRTPNFDRLAARGLVFTQAYAANPLCSPTRASCLTGKYPARMGITTPAGHLPPYPDDQEMMADTAPPWHAVVTPDSRRHLRTDEYTLGDLFHDAGYRTGFVGKWHLGVEPRHWPETQGFEYVFHGAPDPGPPSYFSPYRFAAGTVTNGPDGEYITDRVTSEATGFIERCGDEPWLLCLWHYAVHAPFQAKEDLVAAYRERTDPRGEQDCPTMGGMVESMDQSIGAVLDHLEANGLIDETIIILMSDNGGNMYDTVDGTTPTNNAPLRGGKANIYEGGVREPCVMVVPGVTTPGSRTDALLSSIDFYPTLVDLLGLTTQPNQIIDGVSFAPFLRGQAGPSRETVFCHFPHYTPATGNLPATSVRRGDWKLIRFYDPGPGRGFDRLGNHRNVARPQGRFELYDLADDLSEANNLAAAHPDLVAELDALIDEHLAEIGALVPKPNPNHDPDAFNPMFDEPIDGWTPVGPVRLERGEGTLRLVCTGGDPQIICEQLPDHTGPLTARIRLRSTAAGQGQFFYSTTAARPYHRDRSVFFDITHDGDWHDYELTLPAQGRLLALRLDPAAAAGVIELDWIRIATPDGTALRAWEF